MTRLRSISTLFLALTLPVAVHADDASQRAKAEELVTLQHTEKTVQPIADNIAKQVDDAVDRSVGPDASADQKAKAEDFKKQAAKAIDAKLGWAVVKPTVVDLYVKAFTEDQLDAIVTFYKSPAGVALLGKQQDLNTQFGQLGIIRVNELKAQLQKSFEDYQQSIHSAPTIGSPSSTPALGK